MASSAKFLGAVCFGILCGLSAGESIIFSRNGEEMAEMELNPTAMQKEFSELAIKLEQYRAAYHKGELGTPSSAVSDRLFLAEQLKKSLTESVQATNADKLFLARRELIDLSKFLRFFELKKEVAQENAKLGEEVVLSVIDFGAAGDGVSDDSAAFAAALAEVSKYQGKRVRLNVPEGKYMLKKGTPLNTRRAYYHPDLAKEQTPDWPGHLVFSDFKNFTISGVPGKTTLLLGDWQSMGVIVYRCKNIRIENLILQVDPSPFHQGEILEVYPQERALLWRSDPGFPTPDDPRSTKDAVCQSYNIQTYKLVADASHFFYQGKFEKKGEGLYKLYFRDWSGGIRKGLKLVLPIRNGGFGTSYVSDSILCCFKDVTVYNSRAGVFTDVFSYGTEYIRCRITPDKAKGAYLSSNADGVHCQNDKFGVYVDQCEFLNLGDDSFNTYVKGKLIDKVIPEGVFAAAGQFYDKGETFGIVSSLNGKIKAVRTSQGETLGQFNSTDKQRMTKITKPLPTDIITYDTLKKRPSNKELHEAQAGFDQVSLPDAAFGLGDSGVGTVIRDSYFAGNRNCGLVVQTSSALISGNRIENVNAAAIVVTSLIYPWQEGLYPFNVIVRENKINNVGTGITTGVRVEDDKINAKLSALYNITVSQNIIENCSNKYHFGNLAK